MVTLKNTFLVSALSLGLIVGAVGVAGASTNATTMNTNFGATSVATPRSTSFPTPRATKLELAKRPNIVVTKINKHRRKIRKHRGVVHNIKHSKNFYL